MNKQFRNYTCTNTANNINREKILTYDFVNQVKGEYINGIVDMEKDVYSPYISKNNDSSFFNKIPDFKSMNKANMNISNS